MSDLAQQHSESAVQLDHSLHIDNIVLDCPHNPIDPLGQVLKMPTLRYWSNDSLANKEGYTLLLIHCIGLHKETWTPLAEGIFRVQEGKSPHRRVREAWAFDWPSHGEAAEMNRALLANPLRKETACSVSEWGDHIAAFVRSDMAERRLVAIAHCGGCGAAMNSLKSFPLKSLPYTAVILIEPTITTRELYAIHRAPSKAKFVAATLRLPEQWPSRDAVMAAFLSWHARSEHWDLRVWKAYFDHAFNHRADGTVTIRCKRWVEGASFLDIEPYFSALSQIERVSGLLPIHYIWGTETFLPPEMQHAIVDSSKGRVAASITRVPGGGHCTPHERPDGVVDSICAVLDSPTGTVRSRL
ncbi:Alpha/beta hydrolase family-domain-containing protein [Favolaschia claudopus]|uniref:Alpha/beta hydrolase family-domain-containing protein n=1 Tax=Favolaschia claudopus TaxID=2862362 RepID=A0AAW0C042_9AGAR